MAGYSANAHITRANPRFIGSGRAQPSAEPSRAIASDTPWPARRVDAGPLGPRIREWQRRVRQEWAQTTFYLFDQNSWR